MLLAAQPLRAPYNAMRCFFLPHALCPCHNPTSHQELECALDVSVNTSKELMRMACPRAAG